MAELDRQAPAEVVIGTRTDQEGSPVVSLVGELDSSNAHLLAATVSTITAEHPSRVVFELAGLRFMDSAGLAILVRTAADVETVELREPSRIVRRLLELTGLTSILRIAS